MKKIFKTIAIAIVPIYIAVFLLFIFPSANISSQENKPPVAEIIELWHVDIFEGGSGSRGDFLRQRAIEFEQKNSGKFVLVKTITYEQMINNLKEGQYPDLISYGAGIACDILADICAFNGNVNVYDNFLNSGVLENKVFALPWCSGGYIIAGISEHLPDQNIDYATVLASSYKQKSKSTLYSFITGYAMFNNPLLSAFVANDNITLSKDSLDDKKPYTQQEAYSRFVSKNASVFLLGSQRDAVRLSQRENAADFTMQALAGFTDLVCYISILKNTKSLSICNGFIEYLMTENVQKKLTSINMFSTVIQGLYNEGIMQQIEQNLPDFKILNAFISKEILMENRTTALNALKGDNDSNKKIWEMLP